MVALKVVPPQRMLSHRGPKLPTGVSIIPMLLNRPFEDFFLKLLIDPVFHAPLIGLRGTFPAQPITIYGACASLHLQVATPELMGTTLSAVQVGRLQYSAQASISFLRLDSISPRL